MSVFQSQQLGDDRVTGTHFCHQSRELAAELFVETAGSGERAMAEFRRGPHCGNIGIGFTKFSCLVPDAFENDGRIATPILQRFQNVLELVRLNVLQHKVKRNTT